MIVFKNVSNEGDIILGTDGEDAIAAALSLYASNGADEKLRDECKSLLKYLGK